MGLGPPVCTKCRVLYTFKQSYGWECPICKTNNANYKVGLWESDFTEKELEDNLKFYNFIKGKSNEDSVS
jgi:hypothetical protein